MSEIEDNEQTQIFTKDEASVPQRRRGISEEAPATETPNTEEDTIEAPKKPRQKKEYVMTPARIANVKKMTEARAVKIAERKVEKEKADKAKEEAKLDEKVTERLQSIKKTVVKKPKKVVYVEESSSDEEVVITRRRKSKPKKKVYVDSSSSDSDDVDMKLNNLRKRIAARTQAKPVEPPKVVEKPVEKPVEKQLISKMDLMKKLGFM
jgi:hypothetical protein